MSTASIIAENLKGNLRGVDFEEVFITKSIKDISQKINEFGEWLLKKFLRYRIMKPKETDI